MDKYSGLDPIQLFQEHFKLLKEMSKIEEELNRRRAQDRHIMRAEEVIFSEEASGVKVKGTPLRSAKLVAPELGFNVFNIHAHIHEIPPGSQEGAYHIHGEAVKYYLSGEGVEIIGGKEYRVKAGDTVFVPAGVWHGTQNPGKVPLRIFAAGHSQLTPLMKPIIRGDALEQDGSHSGSV